MRDAAAEIEATAVVPAPPEYVFGFLSDLRNHWRLVDRFVRVVAVDGDAGLVRLHGPLGVRRTVRTRVTALHEPAELEGVAELSGGTRARVCWTLEPAEGGGTDVRLAATVLSATTPDRLLLALGGRTWMRRRFVFGLARLGELTRSAPATPAARATQAEPLPD